jgi:hypothetical protein
MHSALVDGAGVREFDQAVIAVLWLADGFALPASPRFIGDDFRAANYRNTALGPWQFVAVMVGLGLTWAGLDLRYHRPSGLW